MYYKVEADDKAPILIGSTLELLLFDILMEQRRLRNAIEGRGGAKPAPAPGDKGRVKHVNSGD